MENPTLYNPYNNRNDNNEDKHILVYGYKAIDL